MDSVAKRIVHIECDQVAGLRAKVRWLYESTSSQKPMGFAVYTDNGSGVIDFSAPLGNVDFYGRGIHSFETGPLAPGRHRFAVKVIPEVSPAKTYYETRLDITEDTPRPVLSIGPIRLGGRIR